MVTVVVWSRSDQPGQTRRRKSARVRLNRLPEFRAIVLRAAIMNSRSAMLRDRLWTEWP